MAIDNYGDLRQAIALWMNRTDLDTPLIGGVTETKTTIIQALIELAERKIFRDFRGPANEVKVSVPLTTSTNEIYVPDDMLELKSLIINGYPFNYMDSFNFRKAYPNISSSKDSCSFTREGNKFILSYKIAYDSSKTPKHEPVDIIYYADFSGMNENSDTNTVLVTNSDLYLFAALGEAEAYLVNDARVALWQAKYQESIEAIRDYNHQIDYHAGPLIMGGGRNG